MAEMFDVDTLAQELELDNEDIVELLQDFREYVKTTIPELQAAVDGGDCDQSRSLAHALKGSSGNLRVNLIYEIAKKMQDAAEANDTEGLKSLMAELKPLSDKYIEESASLG